MPKKKQIKCNKCNKNYTLKRHLDSYCKDPQEEVLEELQALIEEDHQHLQNSDYIIISPVISSLVTFYFCYKWNSYWSINYNKLIINYNYHKKRQQL